MERKTNTYSGVYTINIFDMWSSWGTSRAFLYILVLAEGERQGGEGGSEDKSPASSEK